MTAGSSSAGASRLPILHSALLLLAAPSAVFLALELAHLLGWRASPDPEATERRAHALAGWFEDRLATSAAGVDRYLSEGVLAA